jgi:hypothetical protein
MEDMDLELLEIGGKKYYIDIDGVSNLIKIDKLDTVEDLLDSTDESNTNPPFGQIIDVPKWEITRAMVETVLSENNPIDEGMGVEAMNNELSIPFKIAFNTLIINKIIKQHE